VTHFKAKFINSNGEIIQTLYTELKENEETRDVMYIQLVSDRSKVGAKVTTSFKSDSNLMIYTVEMYNKPQGTKFIDVELKYSETLKTEYRYNECLFTMTIPRYPLFADDFDVDGAPDINNSSRWVDEIEIIEPSPSEYAAYQIVKSRKTKYLYK
jgi:hypothetical protein